MAADRKPVPIPSEALLKDIQEVVRWFRGHGRGKLNTAAGDPNKDAFFSPETHVALTPPAGIAGLGTETGTGSPHVLNSAECTVWRVDSTGHLSPVGRRQAVYNLGEESVPGATYVVVTRLKERVWMALSSRGPGALIAVAPDGGLPAPDNYCDTTGTGTGTLDPAGTVLGVRCNVYRVRSSQIRLVSGGQKSVYNLGPLRIPECSIFPIWEDSEGHWVATWFDPSTAPNTSHSCTEFSICDSDGATETIRACVGAITVLHVYPGCCTPADDTSGSRGACEGEPTFTVTSSGQIGTTPSGGGGATSSGTLATSGVCQFSVDKYCLTGPALVDAGNGFTCQEWTGGSSLGTITLSKCDTFWCISGFDVNGQEYIECAGVDTAGLVCQPPLIGDSLIALFGNVAGATGGITITAESCGPKCWQNNTTGDFVCSGANEAATSTLIGGPYATQAACDAACGVFCWQLFGYAVGQPGYRYCSASDDSGIATLVSNYPSFAACDAGCKPYYCVEQLTYQSADCTTDLVDVQHSCGVEWAQTGPCDGTAGPPPSSLSITVLSGPYASQADCEEACT